ncbi:MAG: hypothetical protein QM775_15615 [Pirellulales bacterium]
MEYDVGMNAESLNLKFMSIVTRLSKAGQGFVGTHLTSGDWFPLSERVVSGRAEVAERIRDVVAQWVISTEIAAELFDFAHELERSAGYVQTRPKPFLFDAPFDAAVTAS